MDLGAIWFFKDGKDLGLAFLQLDLKQGMFFPFIQVQEKCKLSIFHPSVYPLFKDPIEEEQKRQQRIQEPEPQPRRSGNIVRKKTETHNNIR